MSTTVNSPLDHPTASIGFSQRGSVSRSLYNVQQKILEADKRVEQEHLYSRIQRSKITRQDDVISAYVTKMLAHHGICLLSFPAAIRQFTIVTAKQSFIGIGLRNNKGGIEFYNDSLWRIVTVGASGISLIYQGNKDNKTTECLVFLDILDYLSYLSIMQTFKDVQIGNNSDVIIINSFSNTYKAIEACRDYKGINVFLPAGVSSDVINYTLLHFFGDKVTDCSWFYKNHACNSFLAYCEKKYGQSDSGEQ